MTREVRTLHVPGVAALDGLRRRTQAALDAWGRDWVGGWSDRVELPHIYICVATDRVVVDAGVCETLHAPAGRCWVRRDAGDRVSFDRALLGFGGTRIDEWLASGAAAAWTARNAALCSALLQAPAGDESIWEEERVPRSLTRLGSGAVHIACDELGLFALADGGVWCAAKPAASQRLPALVPLDRAARRSTVQLQVLLGSVELDVRRLLDLRCGDVLRLPQSLDQKLTVACNDRPLGRGFLGALRGRKCVQVFAHER